MAQYPDLNPALADTAQIRRYPDGKVYRAVSTNQIAALGTRFNTSLKSVEVAALDQNIVPERYARNQRSLDCAQQARLLRSRVAVVGQGGLGGIVTETLARLGVGGLILVDGDRFEESNLNRQLLATADTLGVAKTDAARRRVQEINPAVTVHCHQEFLHGDNGPRILKNAQVVVDCLDNLPARFEVAAAARSLNIPLVSAAVAGMGGHVTVFYPEDPGLEQIYGDPAQLPAKGAETALGTLPFAVSALACLECAEVTKILLDLPHVLRGRLLVMDLADTTLEILDLA